MINLKIAFHALLFYTVYFAFAQGISGRIDRSYEVVPEVTEVKVEQMKISATAFVHSHEPKFFIKKDYETPELLAVEYELIDHEDQYTIVFHPIWKDEDVPDQVLNWLYKAYRFVYYGLSLKDIEFLQIDIDKKSDEIVKVMCETPLPDASFYDSYQTHYTTKIVKEGQGYVKTIENEEGEMIERNENFVLGNSKKLNIDVISWNHLMDIHPPIASENYTELDASLSYLTNEEYKNWKLVRRSQGDFKTTESPMNTPIIIFVGLLVLAYFVMIKRDYALQKAKAKKSATS